MSVHLRYLRDLARKSLTTGISQKEERAIFGPLAGLTDEQLDAYEKHFPEPKPEPVAPAAPSTPPNPTTVQHPLTKEEEKAAEAKRAKDPEYAKRRKAAEAEAKKAAKTKE